VFEKRVLRRIFGLKREQGDWRKIHNEELKDLYSSPNFIRVIKSGRMRWVGNVVSTGERRGEVYIELWRGNLRERDHLENPVVGGRIILKYIFKKLDGA